MIHIFYLTAGQSRRWGDSNKLLEIFDGKPLYRHGLEAIIEATKTRHDCTVYVVTCWDDIAKEVAKSDNSVKIVWCAESHLGVSYTIKAAIAAAGTISDEDYMMFAVADQPYLTSTSVTRLLDTTKLHPITACLSNADGTESGNPVMFSSALKDELCALTGDSGGKRVMRRNPEKHIDVTCDSRELYDVDRRE